MDLLLRASNEGLLRPRVARAQKIIRFHPLFCSGSKGPARVSFHPFHRARSASKKGTWPLPIPSFQARLFLLVAGGPIGLLLRASNEHILIVRVPRAQETNGLPMSSP